MNMNNTIGQGKLSFFLPQETKVIETSQTSVHEIKQKELMDLHNTSNDSTLNYSSKNISTSIDSISIDLGLGSNDSNSKDSKSIDPNPSNQISNAQTIKTGY